MSKDTPEYRLRRMIVASLRKQGFSIRHGRLALRGGSGKEEVRRLHALAVKHRRAEAKAKMERHEGRLLEHIANGNEVDPRRLNPRLVPVARRSEEELLFRYIALHWSIPTSSGYGRRLRFIVRDESNQKVIGLLGLAAR